jgi:hypothetical protein
MTRYLVFQFDHSRDQYYADPMGEFDAATPYDACRKAAMGTGDGHFITRNPLGEYAAYPIEGSGVFGFSLEVQAIKIDGKPIERSIEEHRHG